MPGASRSARGDARRKQILDGALSAIREQAIGDVPLASIAAHAGLKPSHVLYYFASRDDVLIAAVTHAEEALAAGRSERLRGIADPEARLAAYVEAYLPRDADDPVWKLWIEGWLRSASHAECSEVGWEATPGWRADLVEVAQHAMGSRALATEAATEFARRFIFLLDGLAVHVIAGHVDPAEAAAIALASLKSELQVDAADSPARDG